MTIKIYIDGSCMPNPGHGGYCAILKSKNKSKTIYGNIQGHCTNNRAELIALLEALTAVKHSSKLEIFTDSQYVARSINNNWVFNWEKQKSLHTRNNGDIWKEILNELKRHKSYKIRWISRNSCVEHELADKLAKEGVKLHDNYKKK